MVSGSIIPSQLAEKERYVLKLRHLWTILPFFIILLRSLRETAPLYDFWWHLKMGQIISGTMAIPRVDSFSFTAAGKLFVVHNWLAEVLYYETYTLGGLALVVFVHGLLAASVLVPLHLLCRKLSGTRWAAILSMCLVSLLIPLNMRPQIFSYLFVSLFYYLLYSYRIRKGNTVWALPVLMILWVNMHGAFVLGLGLTALVLFCETIRTLLSNDDGRLTKRRIKVLGIILLLCVIATLINPEGYKVYEYTWTVFSDPSSRQFVTEWQPPAINQLSGAVLFYIPFFLLTFSLIWTDVRPDLTEFMSYAAFSVFGLIAIRNAPWFLIMAGPLISRYLPKCPCINLGFAKNISGVRKESLILNAGFLIAGLIYLCVHSPWLHAQKLLDPKTPVAAIDYIDKHALQGNIYHPQAYGDYLIWRLWPKQKSFLDGRVHLFDKSHLELYFKIMTDSAWEELLAKHEIRYLLLAKNHKDIQQGDILARARKAKRWNCIYEDSVSVLFEKAP